MTTMRLSRTLASAALLVLIGCAEGAEARDVTTDGAAAAATSSAARATSIRFTVAAAGNSARYRVRERLMGRELDNDAVGETSEISGAIVVDSTGAVVPGQSRIVVGTGAFKSDSDRRDGYVRRRLLESETHPTVELVPTAVRGLPTQLPAAGTAVGPLTFDVVGNLTVRGVTRPTTWRVTARQAGASVTGTAATRFTFADFGITPPRVPIVLSVADTIALEYDFTLTRTDSPPR